MNQFTHPDKITNKDARRSFAHIAPIVLGFDIIAAAIIWFMRDALFEQEANFLAFLVCGGLIVAGVFSYVILKLMSKKVTQIDDVEMDKPDND